LWWTSCAGVERFEAVLRLAAAGEMAAALAHELNQPLTALGAYGKACEFLLERNDNEHGGEMLKSAIQRMIAESGRAADVVRRLRDFFRTGAMKLEPVDAAQLVAGVSQQFVAQLREHGVALEVEAMPPLAMLADRLQIELVLRNLLANALDAVVEQAEAGAPHRRVAAAARQQAPRQGQLPAADGGRQRQGRVGRTGGAPV
jgi:C4-dicarboxylate-specific signal transduction histidine kinase